MIKQVIIKLIILVRIWDIKRGKNTKIFQGQQPVRSVSFNNDSSLLISGSSDMTIVLWDVISGK